MSESHLEQLLAKRRNDVGQIVKEDEPTVTLVIFSLAEDWFAFPGTQIREILAHADVFFVPGCPSSLEGVINVRGDIESVFRLHDLMQIKPPEEEGKSAILLARTDSMSSGLRVDQVMDVVEVPRSALQIPPAGLSEQTGLLASGVLRFRERLVTVLDLEKIFTQYLRGMG